MKRANRSSEAGKLTPKILLPKLMAAYASIDYGKTRKIRALAKRRGISEEAMFLELLKVGLNRNMRAASDEDRDLLAQIKKCVARITRAGLKQK